MAAGQSVRVSVATGARWLSRDARLGCYAVDKVLPRRAVAIGDGEELATNGRALAPTSAAQPFPTPVTATPNIIRRAAGIDRDLGCTSPASADRGPPRA